MPRFMQLNGKVISLQQKEAANISNKDIATGRGDTQRFLQHLNEVLHARKILHYGIQHHQIYAVIREKRELVSKALPQNYVLQIAALFHISSKLPQRLSGKIQS